MVTYVQVGKVWLNITQVRVIRVVPTDDGEVLCQVEFGPDHILEFRGDDAKAIRGYLQYHMTTHPPAGLPG